MENAILGRNKEKEVLSKLLISEKPEFLAVYGRRRVGKTFLISEFFEGKCLFFEFTGTKNSSEQSHLAHFSAELSFKFFNGKNKVNIISWDDGFSKLKECVDNVLKNTPKKKIILFFDELPWIAKQNPEFLESLDYYWNRHFSKMKYRNVLVVICGSAASWMIDNIINDKGGLHNRLTQVIRLKPFSLGETKSYFESKHIALDAKQIVEIYMAIGGIPLYLSFVEKGMSSAQVINKICFQPQSFLLDEFNRLFASLFDNHRNHVSIVRTLASVKKGLNRETLIKHSKLSKNGDVSTVLMELQEAGFIQRSPFWKKKKKGAIFRLCDEYCLFYLNWIEPFKEGIEVSFGDDYWAVKCNSTDWKSWAGYAFEGICLKHIYNIKKVLGISSVLTYTSSWNYKQSKDADGKGAQIDLVMERKDRIIHLFEIKFVSDEFSISKSYKENLENKKQLFKSVTRTKYPVFLTMISTYGIKEDYNYLGTVDNQILLEQIF